MSSAVHTSEVALALRGLEGTRDLGGPVLIGGLGLGHTARAALEHAPDAEIVVVELFDAVLDWHRNGLVPLGSELAGDPRIRFLAGDFFEVAPRPVDDPWRAILIDIDHSPEHLLHPGHAGFYEHEGLASVAARLRPGGRLALWSADPPGDALLATLSSVFADVRADREAFDNPHTGEDENWIVTAVAPGAPGPGSRARSE